MKRNPRSVLASQETGLTNLEGFKEEVETSIEMLMSIDSDMNPFREEAVLSEIITDIRKAGSLGELRRTIMECLEAVKNVVATYLELNRVMENMQGQLVGK